LKPPKSKRHAPTTCTTNCPTTFGQTLIYFGGRDEQESFLDKTTSLFREPRPTSVSFNTYFVIQCMTTWSLLNTTILDRSATTASLLFGSSASQDVLQILYYQLGAISSDYRLCSPTCKRTGKPASCFCATFTTNRRLFLTFPFCGALLRRPRRPAFA
jgi:hypothetical protein